MATGDTSRFNALLYNSDTLQVVRGDTAAGTTGLFGFGAPALDTASLSTTVSALRRPETYTRYGLVRV